MLSIYQMYRYTAGIYVHRQINGKNFHNFSYRRSDGMHTRSIENQFVVSHDTNVTNSRQSVRYSAVKVFNQIPRSVRSLKSFDSFQLKFKRLILDE